MQSLLKNKSNSIWGSFFVALSIINVLETFSYFIWYFNLIIKRKEDEEKKLNSVLIVTWVTPLISIVEHPVGRMRVLFNAAVACRESKGKIKHVFCILYYLSSPLYNPPVNQNTTKKIQQIEYKICILKMWSFFDYISTIFIFCS